MFWPFTREKGNNPRRDIGKRTTKDSFVETLMACSPGILLIFDQNKKLIRANDKLSQILGYKQENLVGKNFSDLPIFVNEIGRKKALKMLSKDDSADQGRSHEFAICSKDKKEFHFVLEERALRDEQGKISGFVVGLSALVTESEESLAAKLKLVSEISAGFLNLKSDDNYFDYIGKNLQKLIGNCYIVMNNHDSKRRASIPTGIYGIKENTLTRIFKIDPKGDVFEIDDYAYKRLLAGYLTKVEGGFYELGQGKWPKAVAMAIEKSLGVTSIYTMGFAWDGKLYGSAVAAIKNDQKINTELIEAFVRQASIALQKRETDIKLQETLDSLEEKVRERTKDLEKTASELEKFKLAVENTSDQVVITDPKGKIIYANKSAEEITGYSKEDIIGKKPSLWGDEQQGNDYKKIIAQVVNEKSTFRGDVYNKRKNGEKYIADLRIDPVLDPMGKTIFLVGIERDITHEKEVDKAKTEFVSLASHQLRTPLSAINWYIELIMDNSKKLSKKQKDYLYEIYGASRRMGELVGSLLNVSRIELGTFTISPEKVDVRKISEEIFKELVSKINKKKHDISKSFPKDTTYVADKKLLRMVLHNLLSNAIKYTPAGGKISLVIGKNKKWLKIKVKDNGYGIPKEQQDKMFTKLFRADNVKEKVSEGTGLGMYIVKSIVDEVGGRITFKSEKNKGTEFDIKMPISGMKKKEGTKKLS